MASNILNDDRVLWIRQRVVLSLDIPVDCFNEYFTDSLARARSAGAARESLRDFLSKKHGPGSAVFFSAEKWTEEKEGAI